MPTEGGRLTAVPKPTKVDLSVKRLYLHNNHLRVLNSTLLLQYYPHLTSIFAQLNPLHSVICPENSLKLQVVVSCIPNHPDLVHCGIEIHNSIDLCCCYQAYIAEKEGCVDGSPSSMPEVKAPSSSSFDSTPYIVTGVVLTVLIMTVLVLYKFVKKSPRTRTNAGTQTDVEENRSTPSGGGVRQNVVELFRKKLAHTNAETQTDAVENRSTPSGGGVRQNLVELFRKKPAPARSNAETQTVNEENRRTPSGCYVRQNVVELNPIPPQRSYADVSTDDETFDDFRSFSSETASTSTAYAESDSTSVSTHIYCNPIATRVQYFLNKE